jgi:hypothetical protein
MYLVSILWLILTQTLSTFPCFVIQQFISKKQILAVTLVDLIYRDTIIYIYLICLVSSTSIIHCLCFSNDNLTLNYEFAMVYSGTISFFVSSLSISLIFSGCLKLISLIKKSEAAGLQLLGPDSIALNKIRLFSFIFSFILPTFMIFFFNTKPGLFPLFYENESTSLSQDIDKNLFKALYAVLPCSAIAVNIITKICSFNMRRNINQQVNVFTISGSVQFISEEKITFSLEASTGVALGILFAFLSSLSDRVERLTIFFPFQIMLMGFIIPMFIIKRDNKIMNFMRQNYINSIIEQPVIQSLIKWKSSTVYPLNEMEMIDRSL